MRISAILDSSALKKTYFNPSYGIQVENFLNDIRRNGLLIVDSENELRDAIFEQVESLPTKYRQRLQIWIEELFKNKRERVVKCCILPNYTSSGNLLDLAYHLRTVSEADTLIVGSESLKTLESDQRYNEDIILLFGHHDNDFEKFYQRHSNRLESINPLSESEMENTIIHSEQFNKWLASVVEEDIFASREKLMMLLENDSSHEALEEEFREFFNGYDVLALELEEHEESVLKIIKGTDALMHLKHRVSAVEAQRKSSTLGREARRMGLLVHGDPVPEIKVTELPSDEFRVLMHTFGNWQLFVSQGRLVQLMKMEQTIEMKERLRAEFCEFFVCYLELELFLENYDYDPDDGLELRPEFIEELELEDEYIRSGGKMYTLEEVAEELGIDLKCTN